MGKTVKTLKKVGGTGLVVAAVGALGIGALIAIKKAFTPEEEGGWGAPGLDTLLPDAGKDLSKFIPAIMKSLDNKKDPISNNPTTKTPPNSSTDRNTTNPWPGIWSGGVAPKGTDSTGGILANVAIGAAVVGAGGLALGTKTGRGAIKTAGNAAADLFARITGKTEVRQPGMQRTADRSFLKASDEAQGVYVRTGSGKDLGTRLEGYNIKGGVAVESVWTKPTGEVVVTRSMPWNMRNAVNEAALGGKLGPISEMTGRPSFVAPGLTSLIFGVPILTQAWDISQGYRANPQWNQLSVWDQLNKAASWLLPFGKGDVVNNVPAGYLTNDLGQIISPATDSRATGFPTFIENRGYSELESMFNRYGGQIALQGMQQGFSDMKANGWGDVQQQIANSAYEVVTGQPSGNPDYKKGGGGGPGASQQTGNWSDAIGKEISDMYGGSYGGGSAPAVDSGPISVDVDAIGVIGGN